MLRFDGSGWSRPALADTAGLVDISCAGPSFCGAVDDAGEALLLRGSSWSRPASIIDGPQLSSLACPTAGWCMAVDGAGSGAYELDSGHWKPAGSLATSTPVGGSEPDTLSAVSCSSQTVCAALDDFGDAFTWAHARWSAPFRFDANLLDQSDSVSCPTASFCMAVDPADVASDWVSGHWSRPKSVADGGASLTDVSCTGAGFCIAVDSRGRELSYRSR